VEQEKQQIQFQEDKLEVEQIQYFQVLHQQVAEEVEVLVVVVEMEVLELMEDQVEEDLEILIHHLKEQVEQVTHRQ
jgi:hypothetical protein